MAFNIAVDRYEVIVKRLQPWFDEENSHLYGEAPVRGEGVLIGCPVWGKEYIERFALSSLPSIGSPANLAALAGHCRMVLYVQKEARPVLFRLTRWLSRAGIDIQFRTIPDWVLKLAQEFHTQFCVLGCAQNVLAHMAGRAGMGFHMLMPDHVYDEAYFPNMFRLAPLLLDR